MNVRFRVDDPLTDVWAHVNDPNGSSWAVLSALDRAAHRLFVCSSAQRVEHLASHSPISGFSVATVVSHVLRVEYSTKAPRCWVSLIHDWGANLNAPDGCGRVPAVGIWANAFNRTSEAEENAHALLKKLKLDPLVVDGNGESLFSVDLSDFGRKKHEALAVCRILQEAADCALASMKPEQAAQRCAVLAVHPDHEPWLASRRSMWLKATIQPRLLPRQTGPRL